jgi:hypothetical protein
VKKSIDHHIASSLLQFLKYKGQRDLEAFHTATIPLFTYEDEKFDKVALGGAEAGWAYNKDIPGIVTPTISGYNRGDNGMSIDFTNGRFLFDPPFTATGLTATVSVDEINWYISNLSSAEIIFETKYEQSPVLNPANSYIPPYQYIVPAVFIKTFETHNEPYSLGGQDWSLFNYRIVCLMPNESYLAAIGGLIRDAKEEIFPLLQGWTLNQLGDLQDLSWNYQDFCRDNPYYAYISDSTFKIEEPDVFSSDNPKLYLGLGNIEVRIVRQPRAPGTDPNLDVVHALTDIDDIFDTDIDDKFILT